RRPRAARGDKNRNERWLCARRRTFQEDDVRRAWASCRQGKAGKAARGKRGLSLISGFGVELAALLHELDRLLLHSLLDVVAHVLRDLHRAEVRPAHRAEVCDLGAFLRQRLVVELPGGVWIEAEVEVVGP